MSVANSMKALNREREDVSKTDVFTLDPDILVEEEGFNTRGAFLEDFWERPEVVAYVRALADAYIRGDLVPPIVVKVIDGVPYIRDGHCRKRALDLAKSEGHKIPRIKVLEAVGDDIKQTALIVKSNDRLKLSVVDRGVAYQRLETQGWTVAEIAADISRSENHVRDVLHLMTAPRALLVMVQNKVVSGSYALELYKEHGTKAVDILQSTKEQLESEADAAHNKGGDAAPKTPIKITKRKVSTGPRITKKVGIAMHASLSSLTKRLESLKPADEADTFVMTLTRAEVEQLQAMQKTLHAIESSNHGTSEPDSQKTEN